MRSLTLAVAGAVIVTTGVSARELPPDIFKKGEKILFIGDSITHGGRMGDLPPNAQRLVRDWLPKHQSELAEMWRTQKIVELPPLD